MIDAPSPPSAAPDERRPANRVLGVVALWGSLLGVALTDPLRVFHGGGAAVGDVLLVTGVVLVAAIGYAVLARPFVRVRPGVVHVRNALREWQIPATRVAALRLGRFDGELDLTDGTVVHAHAIEQRARLRLKGRAPFEAGLASMLAVAHSGLDALPDVELRRTRPDLPQVVHAVALLGYVVVGAVLSR